LNFSASGHVLLAFGGNPGLGCRNWVAGTGCWRGDGRRLWTFNTGDRIQSKIAAADGVIYAGNDGKVYALTG
jgi:outer membrane protein assembly factor BamB